MNIEEAYSYYVTYIFQPTKLDLLKEYNFSPAGSISSVDWEVFGAILTGQKKVSTGPDLKHYEVKSAVEKASFEYQYHLYGGSEKFAYDLAANQVFVSYNPSYANVEIRMAHGSMFEPYFTKWQSEYNDTIKSCLRFRRSIPYKAMVELTAPILTITHGKISSVL